MESQLAESPKTNLDFGQALRLLKDGYAVQRTGWNGKGMFVVKQIPAVIGLDIIPKMQSLPLSAKDILIKRQQEISYTNQMLIVNSEGRADSWVPSSSDCFAEDWEEYKPESVEADENLDQVSVSGEIHIGPPL